MNAADTIKQTENAIAGLSKADKARLLKRLKLEVEDTFLGIEKNPNVMGGVACIRRTRISVWLLEQARRQGVGEADLLRNYPGLSAQDLVNAWDYAAAHEEEIENQIRENEADED